jgi:cytochrome c oxidase subunit I+III
MIIIAFPSVILATTLLELERALNWPFFDRHARRRSAAVAAPVLVLRPPRGLHHLPAGGGAMSTIIPAIAQTPLVGYRLVVLALLATGFISFGVWAHHMFTTGMPAISTSYFSAASMAVSVPAGVQVFAWIATMAAGQDAVSTRPVCSCRACCHLRHGRADRGDGRHGPVRLAGPRQLFHRRPPALCADRRHGLPASSRRSTTGCPMASRRPLSERVGKWVFWLMFAGIHITFLPMHLTGLMGMPRRVYTYLPGRSWEIPNLISTVGAFLFALAC